MVSRGGGTQRSARYTSWLQALQFRKALNVGGEHRAGVCKVPGADRKKKKKVTAEEKLKVNAQLSALGDLSILGSRRRISIRYRGIEMQMWARSFVEELDWKCAACVRGMAVECGALCFLVGELDLLPLSEVVEDDADASEIDRCLISDASAARSFANSLLRALPQKTGAAVQDTAG